MLIVLHKNVIDFLIDCVRFEVFDDEIVQSVVVVDKRNINSELHHKVVQSDQAG